MISSHFLEIQEHFEKEYPREGCGLLTIKKGKSLWVPCSNLAENDDEFVIDSSQYLKAYRTSDIIGIIHSHPDGSCRASEADIAVCNTLGIPYYIFSYPGMELNILQPESNLIDLYGREYKFGVRDCFEAARDYFKTVGIETKPRIFFEDNWWLKDLNYFSDELIKEWNFEPVDTQTMEKNDFITFSVNSHIPNHCGVYLGNDVFYHHAENRLSCREPLYPFWFRYIDKVYRYVA